MKCMTDYEKEEFWKALGRLYDTTVKLAEVSQKDGENIRALAEIVRSHEQRLEKLEGGTQKP